MIYGHVFDDPLKRIVQHPSRGVCRHIHDEVNLELLRIMTTTIHRMCAVGLITLPHYTEDCMSPPVCQPSRMSWVSVSNPP